MIKNSKAMMVWEEELSSKSEGTRQEYHRHLDRFLTEYGYTHEELYKVRKLDLESDDTRDHRNIERKVAALMGKMIEEGYSSSYARGISKAVGSFLMSQGLDLKVRSRDKPRAVYNGQNLALIEDIRIMWRDSSVRQRERNRAIIMTGKDSGLRVSDISNLDRQDYFEAREIKVNECRFKIFKPKTTIKTGDIAHIHLGPESIDAIDKYLEIREDNDSALFLDQTNKRMTEGAMTALLLRLGDKTSRDKISAHSLRKFHRTKLEGAGMPEAWVKRLQGKSASVYSLPQQSGDLTNRYVECYHALKIFDEPERHIRELESEIAKLRGERNNEIEELRRMVHELQEERDELVNIKADEIYKKVLARMEKVRVS